MREVGEWAVARWELEAGVGGCLAQGRGFWWREHGQTSWAGLLSSSGQWTLTWDVPRLPCGSPRPVAAIAMLTPRIAALLTLLLASSSLGQRVRRPPRPPSPISTIQPKANFDAQQVEPGRGGAGRGPPGSAAPHTACSPVRRDLAPGGCGLPVSLPAGAGPPG